MVVTKTQVLAMFGFVLMGFAILIVSLVASNRALVGHQMRFSAARVYVHGPMLPDHPLYAVLMVRDRVGLWSASPEEKVPLKVTYAEERRERAMALLDQGQHSLAVSTFSKSQKYLLQAARLCLALPESSAETLLKMAENVDRSLWYTEQFKQQAQGPDQGLLMHLSEETVQVRELLYQSAAQMGRNATNGQSTP